MTGRASRALVVAAFVVWTPASLLAQSSATYKLTEHVFNAGGRPAEGVVASSTSYRLSLDSIGESTTGQTLAGTSYRVDAGLASTNRPPGEVGDLQILADLQTLTWSWEPASMEFNVYSGPLNTLPGGYGSCAASRVPGATWADPTTPASRSALFYLVTGENRLRQEGTMGYASSGAERETAPACP